MCKYLKALSVHCVSYDLLSPKSGICKSRVTNFKNTTL